MTKFKSDDVVIVVGVTDLDGDYGDAGSMIVDPKHEATMDWQNPAQTLIGQVGKIVEASMNDYYDVTIRFPWNAENEDCAMKEQDLALVTAWRVIGTIPTPMYDPKRPVFDHDPSTRPPTTGKASKPYAVGEAGRTLTVTTEHMKVAESLASVWASKGRDGSSLFLDVKVVPVTA